MSAIHPVNFRWSGTAMIPLVPALAGRQFEKGEVYRLEVREDRSSNSHRAYFAEINDGFQNLPEHQAERFPTANHLRKWLLIRAGYRDERTIVLANKAEALRVAAFIEPMDSFAVVVPREATVVVMTAKSQSYKAMGRAEFQRSKEAVLDALAELLGVERKALDQNAGRAA